MTGPESVPEVREEWVEAVAEAVGVHRWKDMGVDWCSCECGQVLCADPSDPLLTAFPADDVFREHIARAALAALVPLIEADVGERIAAAMVETPADRVTWDDGTEFISSADAQRIARAVATGDEGGQ